MISVEGASVPSTFRNKTSPRRNDFAFVGWSVERDIVELLFEGEVQRLGFTSRDGYLLGLGTQLFLPCRNRVGARR
jgi:hypothetical protein